ncbi:uncharacterized protein LOC132299595 [Cornus florida]|uniref:uncharacterized protein LOC132299595 n=1 Tax=Cornus florida TaxID=4283 RepID=UPI002898E1D1|nr:uncharacterized protein LOC132299595 [Cornus florida]XP_059652298.1 uncharacterized protein LOC132299595 [Cornus florida]XP_059652299.1 uncharacterized protein LOC132299595 [Cornus florida]
MDLQKKRIQFLLFVVGIIVLSITAEKCRQLVGEEASSKSGQFTFLNCFDGGSGTVACLVKEGVKLYFYNIRASHVERARHQAIEKALVDAMSQGLAATDAAKQAQKEGAKAAKLATRQAKRIIGPIISSGWDFFEAIYFGGTMTEGFLRGSGTLVGTYAVGFLGEQRFGRFGYLVGSQLGSWVGGRIGLMVYDVVNGVHYFIQFVQPEETKLYESTAFESTEASEESYVNETPTDFSSEPSEDPNNYESPVYESSEGHEDL